jgi:hypothetical protein
VAHLACGDWLGDGAGDVLDRHVGVDTMLVEQVERIGTQAAQGGSAARAICSGRLSRPTDIPSSMRHPNLVAITTWSRSGAGASPTSSSLT